MFKTKKDLSEATRTKVVELLNARLADCTDLQTQTKQAHWNVKGEGRGTEAHPHDHENH
jgi:starvation-inducible DNA-binding protein